MLTEFLTDKEVSEVLGRGAGMFHIPPVLSDGGGFYVAPEDEEQGVVVVLANKSAIMVSPEEFLIEGDRARWIGEGSRSQNLKVIWRFIKT